MSVTDAERHDDSSQPPAPIASLVAEVGELAWVDPRDLVVRANVRADAALDRHFVRDIADRGVREPIPVRRRDDGAMVVRRGHRRALAAIDAGLQRVRVFVEPGPPGEDAAGDQIDRIIDQLGENQHRARLTDAALSGIASDASFDRTPRTLVRDPPWPERAPMAPGFGQRNTPGTWRPSSMLG